MLSFTFSWLKNVIVQNNEQSSEETPVGQVSFAKKLLFKDFLEKSFKHVESMCGAIVLDV